MKSKLEYKLKTSLGFPETSLDYNHLQKVVAAAQDEFIKKGRRNRINFTAFLIRQIKYTGWKIWAAQGLTLIVLCVMLSVALGDFFLSKPQHIAVLLSASAILVLMTAIPFIQRGMRYKMHEFEAAAKFSSVKLLAAKLLIIGIGDGIMLGSVLLLALFQTEVNIGTVTLYLMLPFLTVTSACLYVLGHVAAHRFSVCCGCIGAIAFMIVSASCYLYPEIAEQTFTVSWGFICIILTIFSIYQLHYILRRSSYSEIQLT